jgi:hypothetical protein
MAFLKFMLSLLINCMEIMALKWFVTIFDLGLWKERGVWVYINMEEDVASLKISSSL